MSHTTPILKSLHWLKINERSQYKILYLTFKLLYTTQPPYLYDLISLQTPRNTRSSSVVTFARPSTRSSLKITSRSFLYASPYLWNQLPHSLRRPRLDLPLPDRLISSPRSFYLTSRHHHSYVHNHPTILLFQPQNFFSQILPSIYIWHLFGLIFWISGLLYSFFLVSIFLVVSVIVISFFSFSIWGLSFLP